MGDFAPFPALAGGLLIGLSTSAMLIFNGKVAGISGIVGALLSPSRGDVAWRVLFVAGLLLGGFTMYQLSPQSFDLQAAPRPLAVVVAGLLVGFGTRLGNGCTSGHGVCGVGRLSNRSIAATLTFIAAGAGAVYVRLHLLGG
jgi:uncharacterized membrane protein YedE/YeeE